MSRADKLQEEDFEKEIFRDNIMELSIFKEVKYMWKSFNLTSLKVKH